MEELEKNNKTVVLSIKITPDMDKEIRDLVKEKNWRIGAFLRQAITESIEKVKK